MASGVNIGVYKPILSVKEAWSFDFGAALMRIYTFMVTVACVSMLTLMGYSVFFAGAVSSCVALATFLISPRVSKRIDELGQSRVVPLATIISMAGLACMLAIVSLELPFGLCFFAAIAMGFVPNASAIARARWTYLIKIQGEKHAVSQVDIKTVFSYEGVIDDISFMIGPAAAVALSACLFPIAGMVFGGLCYVLGAILLLASKSTEPEPGWASSFESEENDCQKRSLFIESSQVRVLFFLMFGIGALYGVLDTATITFGQDLGVPVIASVALVVQAIISIISGTLFGATRLRFSLLRQWIVVCCLIGVSYSLLAFVTGTVSFFIVVCLGALFYAPFLITLNTACERSVNDNRLTEGITWITAGMTFGLAVGPTIAGVFVDEFGSIAGFNVAAAFAVFILVVTFTCIPVMRKKLV